MQLEIFMVQQTKLSISTDFLTSELQRPGAVKAQHFDIKRFFQYTTKF